MRLVSQRHVAQTLLFFRKVVNIAYERNTTRNVAFCLQIERGLGLGLGRSDLGGFGPDAEDVLFDLLDQACAQTPEYILVDHLIPGSKL